METAADRLIAAGTAMAPSIPAAEGFPGGSRLGKIRAWRCCTNSAKLLLTQENPSMARFCDCKLNQILTCICATTPLRLLRALRPRATGSAAGLGRQVGAALRLTSGRDTEWRCAEAACRTVRRHCNLRDEPEGWIPCEPFRVPRRRFRLDSTPPSRRPPAARSSVPRPRRAGCVRWARAGGGG